MTNGLECSIEFDPEASVAMTSPIAAPAQTVCQRLCEAALIHNSRRRKTAGKRLHG